MIPQINKTTECPEEVREKPGSKFSETNINSLEDITGELLSYTVKSTGLGRNEVEKILNETVQLVTYNTSMGHTCKLPHGLMGLVLLPEVDEFSNVGITSKLFWKERLILCSFNEQMKIWGYENIPSGKMNRALRKKLSIPKCATKIQRANETSVLRYHYLENHREYRE
jgi:hypothetical protein